MRATIVAALIGAVAAVPAVIVTDVVDVYTTVWVDPSAPTTAAPVPNKWWGMGWNQPAASPAAASPSPVAAAASPAWSPAAAAASPAASAATGSYSGAGEATPSDYSAAVVAHHNAHRANHSAADIVWDDGLASTAQLIASSCVYAHNVDANGGGYGQNIAAGAPSSNISSVITDLFYNNEVGNYAGLYGQATPSTINDATAFDGYGHFTQIVWKGTTKVGCATVDCTASGLANTGSSVPPYFTVCNYEPAGNFLGEFADNVGEPLGDPSITWAST